MMPVRGFETSQWPGRLSQTGTSFLPATCANAIDHRPGRTCRRQRWEMPFGRSSVAQRLSKPSLPLCWVSRGPGKLPPDYPRGRNKECYKRISAVGNNLKEMARKTRPCHHDDR